jgi:hypothetical protein
MGFWDKLNENRVTYTRGAFTIDAINEAVNALFQSRPLPNYTLLLGLVSYELMDFGVKASIFKGLNWWYDVPKRVKNRFIYVSFFKKHSLYKMKIHIDKQPRGFKYELFYGTTSLGFGDSVHCINNLIELKKAHGRLS